MKAYQMQSQHDLVGWGSKLACIYGPEVEVAEELVAAVGYRTIDGKPYYLVRVADNVLGVKVTDLPKSAAKLFKSLRKRGKFLNEEFWIEVGGA